MAKMKKSSLSARKKAASNQRKSPAKNAAKLRLQQGPQAKNSARLAARSPQEQQAKIAMGAGTGAIAKGEPMPFWVFIVAALLMACVAFAVVLAGMHKGGEAITPPLQNGSGNDTGGAVYPKVAAPDLSDAYYVGPPGADVTFVEYSDFQCPYCAGALPAIEQAMKNYPDVRFVFRHFPLDMHANARKAAEAAECAGKQGKFWQMHDAMFANQEGLSTSDLENYAGNIGLDTAAFASCLDSGQMAAAVSAEKQEGVGNGIRGTPGFLVYSSSDKSQALRQRLMAVSDRFGSLGARSAILEMDGAGMGIVFAGAMPYSDYRSVIEAFSQPKAG